MYGLKRVVSAIPRDFDILLDTLLEHFTLGKIVDFGFLYEIVFPAPIVGRAYPFRQYSLRLFVPFAFRPKALVPLPVDELPQVVDSLLQSLFRVRHHHVGLAQDLTELLDVVGVCVSSRVKEFAD